MVSWGRGRRGGEGVVADEEVVLGGVEVRHSFLDP